MAPQPVTPERILQFAWGFAPPLMLEAAIRHRVFDVLDDGAKTLEDVSRETGASVRGLSALMTGLAAFDFVSKDGELYSLTPESAAFLVSHKPAFQGGLLRQMSAQIIPGWLHLNNCIESGQPVTQVNDEAEGGAFFEDLVQSLFALNYAAAQVLAAHLKLEGAKAEGAGLEGDAPIRVLDLAAGSGVWGIALAQSSPQVHITVVDWEQVLPIARCNAEKFGLSERLDTIAGDIADVPFGDGFAVATLGHILHSEGRQRSRALLKKTFEALSPGGTIAIAEFLVNEERSGPPSGAIFAVNMLLHTKEGDAYSFEEISEWLLETGFENPRLLPAPAPSPLVLAT
ncbi:MAG TPA: class I SAM-dependent methyltransferase, partial [Abditibacteriaceae bacterium]|nr:class I SAM-dependent methyltransferase [Abditibacteriaceae bacterium]